MCDTKEIITEISVISVFCSEHDDGRLQWESERKCENCVWMKFNATEHSYESYTTSMDMASSVQCSGVRKWESSLGVSQEWTFEMKNFHFASFPRVSPTRFTDSDYHFCTTDRYENIGASRLRTEDNNRTRNSDKLREGKCARKTEGKVQVSLTLLILRRDWDCTINSGHRSIEVFSSWRLFDAEFFDFSKLSHQFKFDRVAPIQKEFNSDYFKFIAIILKLIFHFQEPMELSIKSHK